MRTRRSIGIMLALALVAAPAAFATNGYFMHGIGTASKAMAGASTALAQEALDSETNPAAGVFVNRGYSASLALFSPDRSYDVQGNPSGMPQTFGLTPGRVTSESTLFPMPSLGFNFRPSDVSAVTLNLTAHGGMNTDYRTSTFYGSDHTGVDLSQMFVSTTYARKVTTNQSLGVSAIVAAQRFKASGLEAFSQFSSDATALTGNGSDWSYGLGVKIGYLAKPTERLSVGATYAPKISMSEFDKYSGLFAEGGTFDIPASANVGVAYELTEPLTLTADYQRIHYSDVRAVGNHLMPNLMTAPLGTDGGAGFGWKDINVYKVGAQWAASDVWTFRAGYSRTDQPIPESEVLFNILAPGVIEDHFTVGFSKTLVRTPGRFNMAVMYAPSQTVTGANPMEIPGGQQISLTMNEWEVEVGYSYGF